MKTTHLVQSVTCNMKLKCGGVEGGWMQAVDVDMNRDDSCPGKWHIVATPRRLCTVHVHGCTSVHFYVLIINTFVDKLKLISRTHECLCC